MKQRKTRDIYVIESNYGYGWEFVCACDTPNAGRQTLLDYIANDKYHPYRLKRKLEKIPQTGLEST